MAEGRLPHENLSIFKMTKAIVNDQPPSLVFPFWSSRFRHFVRMCLMKEASQRPATSDLLAHPFITTAPSQRSLRPLLVRFHRIPKLPKLIGSLDIFQYSHLHAAPLPQRPISSSFSFRSGLPQHLTTPVPRRQEESVSLLMSHPSPYGPVTYRVPTDGSNPEVLPSANLTGLEPFGSPTGAYVPNFLQSYAPAPRGSYHSKLQQQNSLSNLVPPDLSAPQNTSFYPPGDSGTSPTSSSHINNTATQSPPPPLVSEESTPRPATLSHTQPSNTFHENSQSTPTPPIPQNT